MPTLLPFQPVANVARAVLGFEISGQPCSHRLHFYRAAGWEAASLIDLAEGLQNWWYANVRYALSVDCVLTRTRCVDLTTEAGAYGESDVHAGAFGDKASARVPASVSKSVEFYTAASGPTGRGRIKFSGFAFDNIDDDAVDIETADGLTACCNLLLGTGVISPGSQFGIVSLVLAGVRREAGLFRPALTCSMVNTKTGTQRTRIPD